MNINRLTITVVVINVVKIITIIIITILIMLLIVVIITYNNNDSRKPQDPSQSGKTQLHVCLTVSILIGFSAGRSKNEQIPIPLLSQLLIPLR